MVEQEHPLQPRHLVHKTISEIQDRLSTFKREVSFRFSEFSGLGLCLETLEMKEGLRFVYGCCAPVLLEMLFGGSGA